MDLWEYTKLAAPAFAGSFAVCFVVVEGLNAVCYVLNRYLRNRMRPRGRDRH